MKCKKCNKKISFLEWVFYLGYCFIHNLEKNGEINLKSSQKDEKVKQNG